MNQEMLFTMFFYSHSGASLPSTSRRKNSGYYLDFNLPWRDGLDEKTIKAFHFYVNIFERAPEDQVTLEFYFSQPKGISRDVEITKNLLLESCIQVSMQ